MNVFPFSLITPEGKFFQGDVQSVTAPGQLGSFGVLAKHAPMINALRDGVLTVKTTDKESFFAINSGIFEIDRDGKAVALIDNAIPSQNVEEAKANLTQFKH